MIKREEIKKDLYEAVNGEWIKTAVIPDDKPTIGGFQNLVIGIEELLMNDFNNLKDVESKEMKEFLKYYNMTKDFKTRNEKGVEDLKVYIDKIKNIKDFNDFEKLSIEFFKKGLTQPMNFYVTADMMEATKKTLYLDVPHTILPDKIYYGTEDGDKLLAVYMDMLAKVYKLHNFKEEEAKELIDKTISFDKLIYPHVKTSEELADYTKLYNKRSLDEVEKYIDVFSMTNIIESLINVKPEFVIVEQPIFFENFKKVINKESLELLKAWLLSNLVLYTSSMFTEELRVTGGIYSRSLSGVDKAMSSDKYAFYKATSVFDQVVSVYYGLKYFGPEAKKDVEKMIVSMIKVYEKRLRENTWLKEETKKQAVKKLETLEILTGYPETYHEVYKKLIVDENLSFFANTIKFNELMYLDMFSEYGKDVDRLEWGMSSSTVNAYYNPNTNHICFPAAILQKPFYSLKQTKSENYGGIGAVIAHEISHAFDNNGSKFDEKGNLNNWWTEEDYKIFDDKAKDMIALFDGIPYGSSKVNGTLTVSENIADAGGLSCALEALKNQGEYNLEEFFINWAKVWQLKAKPEYVDLLLKTDVHAPGKLRANMQVKNLQEFYETFDITKDDEMYLEEEKRVNIW